MKKIIIFFLLFFVFVTLINSYPHRNIRKRVERVGRFRQCSGTFPITYTEATYTPETIISGQLVTEHFKGKSTITIEPKSIMIVNGYSDNTLAFSSKFDFCDVVFKPNNMTCPIPPGHLDVTFPWPTHGRDPN